MFGINRGAFIRGVPRGRVARGGLLVQSLAWFTRRTPRSTVAFGTRTVTASEQARALEDGVRAEVVGPPTGERSGKMARAWVRREGDLKSEMIG